MKFLSLEDLSGTFEAVLFPRTYDKYAVDTLSMGPFILEGKVDVENGNNLVVDKLEILTVKELKASVQKDSVEHNYYGDKEKVTEEELLLATSIKKENLVMAYAG